MRARSDSPCPLEIAGPKYKVEEMLTPRKIPISLVAEEGTAVRIGEHALALNRESIRRHHHALLVYQLMGG